LPNASAISFSIVLVDFPAVLISIGGLLSRVMLITPPAAAFLFEREKLSIYSTVAE